MKASIWVLGDQLLRVHPAVDQAEKLHGRDNIVIVMVESRERTQQLPYQAKKLVLLFSAMRHYAEALRADGYLVDYVYSDRFSDGLLQHIERYRPKQLLTMAASEYHTRQFQQRELQNLVGVEVDVLPNTQFLVGMFDPHPQPDPERHYVMEPFYRKMRTHFRVLLDDRDQPIGGRWNYDEENRKPLPRTLTPPAPAAFEPDALTQAVMEEVGGLATIIGRVEGFALAVTHAQAAQALDDFIAHRLEHFGAYEDAMTTRHRTLYHSVLSPYLNIGLLEPMQMIRAAERAYAEGRAPLNSVEGFIRQIIGWREFIYWQYWFQMPALGEANSWNARRAMPQMFWDAETDMNCIRHVVQGLLDDGYSHHIERLMIICNFCLLAGVNPRVVADWFLSFYVDAYEWVVFPNVIGMGLNADGGRTATKPYIASANYINKMSDYCKGCRFKQAARTGDSACPFNYLYWNFVLEHEETLRRNPRTSRSALGLRNFDDAERAAIRAHAHDFLAGLLYYES